ncbi:hypothetical protein SNK04_014393 [Fusarium graminearum]
MLSMQAKHRILCVREIQKSIAQSSKRVIEDYINRMGLGAYFKINKQGEDQITCILTGSTFSFTGLQDHTADSIKSFEGATIVWVEEASNVSTNSWNKLIPTIVRTTGAEIWVTFNPDQQDDYAYKRWVLGDDPDAIVIQINWLDNPWWNQPMETERLKTLAISQDLHDHIFGGQPEQRPASCSSGTGSSASTWATSRRACASTWPATMPAHRTRTTPRQIPTGPSTAVLVSITSAICGSPTGGAARKTPPCGSLP